MSSVQEANKATFNRLHAAVSGGDAELYAKVIDEVVAPEVLIRHHCRSKRPEPKHSSRWRRCSCTPSPTFTSFGDMIAEADKVVCRNTVTGTRQGEYMGVPPTGKSVNYKEIVIVRFAETWGVIDVLSQIRQLGTLRPNEIHSTDHAVSRFRGLTERRCWSSWKPLPRWSEGCSSRTRCSATPLPRSRASSAALRRQAAGSPTARASTSTPGAPAMSPPRASGGR